MPQRRFRQFTAEQPIALWSMVAVSAAVLVAFVVTEDLASAWPWLLLTLVLSDALLLIPITLSVDGDAIRVSLAGVMHHDIPVTGIASVERRRYRPLRQFGGWGWRYGKAGSRQFAMAGSEAVVLTMMDGTEMYLGARDLDALAAAVDDARAGRVPR
ncbi:hypothetical protein [Demequina pelophila]|uniref:hypothetical protein n=1 Tax=Demequina pelophila TaxID=1638984 RepID=UPI000783C40D|nr:hypothetical protein [Demequina pelophila]